MVVYGFTGLLLAVLAWPCFATGNGEQANVVRDRPERGKTESAYRSLCNGRDLSGWRGAIDSYEVIEGCIVCKPGKGGVLYYEEELTDFQVELEFRLPAGGNNGLAIRYPGQGQASVDAMCELQVLDDEDPQYAQLDPRQYHGAIYGMVPPKRGFLRPVGEWNRQQVTVIGHAIRVVLNGTEIVNADIADIKEFKGGVPHPGKDRLSGYFGFAGHNDPVQFRNIRLKRLDPYRLAHFSVDATIPLGHRCMGILPQKSRTIADPLWVHGLAILGPQLPVALVAVDWCEIRNASYDAWRDRIARGLGTTRERVFVSCLHQHDAPVIDHGAQELLDEQGLQGELFDVAFHENLLQEVEQAARRSLDHAESITHLGLGTAIVEQIASSRRVVDAKGRVTFERGSSSGKEERLRQAEEGLIDPALRTLSFWNGERCLLELHHYATHPMSYYGQGEVSSDFVGLARYLRQREQPNVKQMYVSGCSGDVTAGKYNDGTPGARQALAQRLLAAMQRSSDATEKWSCTSLAFQNEPLNLHFSSDASLAPEAMRARVRDQQLPIEQRILAAMGLSSWQRTQAGASIDMPRLSFGKAQVLLFPGECFVGYQLLAQQLSPQAAVLSIGYGDSWTGYIPTEEAFAEKFHENWQWVDVDAPGKIKQAMQRLLSSERGVDLLGK